MEHRGPRPLNHESELNSIHGNVETVFAQAYLLLPGKIAVGGLLALAVPQAGTLERSFYSIASGICLLLSATMAAATWSFSTGTSSMQLLASVAWSLFTVSLAVYYGGLFWSSVLLRARMFPVALALGFLALSVSTASLISAAAGVWKTLLLVPPWTGAALCGASLISMLLGHFYLVDRGLDVAILERMRRYCIRCLVVEVAVVSACLAAAGPFIGFQSPPSATSTSLGPLVAGRLLAWGVAGILLVLIGKTLKIPQPMAATGLFYVCSLAVLVGEICGHWLLFRTGLPL